MKKQMSATGLLGKPLNTLAQNETTIAANPSESSVIIVTGNGSELSNSKAVKGRAKRKMITQATTLSLVDIARKKEQSERLKGYWNTYHCQSKIYTSEGRLYGKYCKNRFCTLCCAIRKADIINRYLPVIQQWEEPYFVTLTARSVRLKSLAKRMRDMNRGFRIISSRYRKRAQRGKGIKLMGIKSLECNFNPVKQTYNPHLHIIVANKQMAEILVEEWLRLCTTNFAYKGAQKAEKVWNKEKALIEIVKYGSKIFTEPDVDSKSSRQKGDPTIYASALDNIFSAMKGIRIFDRFGFNLPTDNRNKESKALLLSKYEEWVFDPKSFDWINTNTDTTLSGYMPALELQHLLAYSIDKYLE